MGNCHDGRPSSPIQGSRKSAKSTSNHEPAAHAACNCHLQPSATTSQPCQAHDALNLQTSWPMQHWNPVETGPALRLCTRRQHFCSRQLCSMPLLQSQKTPTTSLKTAKHRVGHCWRAGYLDFQALQPFCSMQLQLQPIPPWQLLCQPLHVPATMHAW